jgi:hypothetical protein
VLIASTAFLRNIHLTFELKPYAEIGTGAGKQTTPPPVVCYGKEFSLE